MARKKKCDASKVSKPPSIDTADDGYYAKKEGGKQVIAVIFETAYHVSAVGIVIILAIFTLCQYIENIRLANESDDE